MFENNKNLLKDSIKILKKVLKEQHDIMDNSKRKELERIIQKLEESQEEYTSYQLLKIIGKCLATIPAVIRVIEYLSKK